MLNIYLRPQKTLFKFVTLKATKIQNNNIFAILFFIRDCLKREVGKKTCYLFLQIEDPFYLILFSFIAKRTGVRAFHCPVRGINSAIGNNLWARIKRSSFTRLVKNFFWSKLYAINCGSYLNNQSFLVAEVVVEAAYSRFLKFENHEEFSIEGIKVGDLIIDTYLRFAPSISFDKNDQFVKFIIRYFLIEIRRWRTLLNCRQIDGLVTSYCAYGDLGIPVRVALNEGVAVKSFGSPHAIGQTLSLQWPFHTPASERYRIRKQSLMNRRGLVALGRRKLLDRLGGKVDYAISYMQTSPYAMKSKDLSNTDGGFVIFLHHFYDCPHIYPNILFTDFWDWFVYTVNTLERLEIKYFVKPHPLQKITELEEVERFLGCKKFGFLLDREVSNNDLCQSGVVAGLSVYGTVAHEFAVYNIPVLVCSDNPHSEFSFNLQACSLNEFDSFIQQINGGDLDWDVDLNEVWLFYAVHNLEVSWRERKQRKLFYELRRALDSESVIPLASIQNIFCTSCFDNILE